MPDHVRMMSNDKMGYDSKEGELPDSEGSENQEDEEDYTSGTEDVDYNEYPDRDTPLSETIPEPSESTPNRSHVNPERDNYNVDKITDCWKCGTR